MKLIMFFKVCEELCRHFDGDCIEFEITFGKIFLSIFCILKFMKSVSKKHVILLIEMVILKGEKKKKEKWVKRRRDRERGKTDYAKN